MAIALSCGLVLLNEDAEVLLAHATETHHWDIPKGAPEPGESDLDTALRETREETGLVLGAHALIELGRFPLRRDKDVHLFATRLHRADVSLDALTCTSMFTSYRSGRLIPRWTPTAGPVPMTCRTTQASRWGGCLRNCCHWRRFTRAFKQPGARP